jgi:ADP-heptose:LPS heptosyltransferase
MGHLRKPAAVSKPKPLSLRDFYAKRNRILIWHDKGGLGDVLMQRMLFADFKAICPEADLIFACLPEYMDAAKDHPCLSEVVDSRTVNINDYINHYNTCVSIADRYENINAPMCLEHRADIWAKYCGVTLNKHEMQFRFNPAFLEYCRKKLRVIAPDTNKPTVLFAPVSKMAVKTLMPSQIEAVVEATKDCNLVGLHNKDIADLTRLGIPGIYGATIKEWMAYIAVADYVVSVDTATFHMAGGLKKPLVGIFTFADGKAYGKHFNFVLVQKHRDNGNWDCGPCFKFGDCPKCNKAQKPCLTELSREELQTGIRTMFERWPYGKNRISLA